MKKRSLCLKVSQIKTSIHERILRISGMIALAYASLINIAYATGNGTKLFEFAVETISKVMYVPAGFLIVIGIFQWASAPSDGDGPSQKKATNMISAGIMLAVVATILIASKSTLSAMITTT